MTDLKKLRELAEKATFDASIWESEEEAPKAWKDNSVNNAAWCRAANPETVIALIDRIEKLEAQLEEANEIAEFYASCKHFEWLGKDDFAPENPSGEPSNIECGGDDDNQFTLENGGLALAYLMKWKVEK